MKLGGKTLAFILLFVALVLVTFLGSQIPARFDFTADEIYTLSPGTHSLLEKVEEPIAFQFYYTREAGSGSVPVTWKNYASRIEEMLRQFAAASDGRIKVSIIDPQPDTDEESAARAAGLTQQPLRNGDPFYLGLVIAQGGEEKTIPFFDQRREQFLEYDLAKLVQSVQQIDRPKLGLLSSLPLQGSPFPMPGQPQQPSQLAVTEWENAFEVVTVEESAEELPADLDLLAVVHPQNLSESLQFSIDQFLLSGKPVLLAVDPSSIYMRQMQRQNQMMMMQQPQDTSSNLPKLLLSYGINYDPTHVVGDAEKGWPPPGQTGRPEEINPTWIVADARMFNTEAQPMSSLDAMWLIEPGAVSVATDRGYEVTPLIQTSEQAGTVQTMMLGMLQPADIAKQFKTEGGQRTIAAMIHGTFKSAFPMGKPKAAESAEENNAENSESSVENTDSTEAANASTESNEQESAAPLLTVSEKPSTLIVIADSDWLLDMTSVQRIPQINAYMPLNDNLAFATNVVDFLAGSEDLIAIRGKGRSQRPFEVIARMETVAQAKYQAAMADVDQRLADIQQQLNKLVQEQNTQQQIVATPEMREAIENFRAQEATARAERRAIRRQLREGIESLQNRLTLANLLVVPIAVIAIGIYYTLSRQTRRKAA